MQYRVRAVTASQQMADIMVEALDEADARRQIEAQGMLATAVVPLNASKLGFPSLLRSTRFSLVLFSQELLALLTAGLSIVEALEALLEKEDNATTQSILNRLLSGLREGKRFSTVLDEQPQHFHALYIGIIKAAEGTSDLPQSLRRYIDYQERIDAVRSKIISATIYPVILLIVGGAVTLFLIGYVVPRFAQVYRGAGRDLPWMSQLLLDWGQFAASHAKGIAIFLALALAALFLAGRHYIAQGKLASLIARLPGIGERVRIYSLSRLYLTLGMLLEGGIAIVAAMHTVEGVVAPEVRTRLRRAAASIEAGTPLSAAFEAQQLTTPISARMLRVGERSGELGQMLNQSAAFYDGELSRWIDRFTRSFEPLLMAAIGLIVGTIVVLLYMPIFDLAGSLS